MINYIFVAVLFVIVAVVAPLAVRYYHRVVDDLIDEIYTESDKAFANGWDAAANACKMAVEPMKNSRQRIS